mmetsp:Transcript_171/g.422  ORF Transcript_171/g.422 Transcript_171/m.422 type:complete len:268 (-) Transcript_171:128-931(-)
MIELDVPLAMLMAVAAIVIAAASYCHLWGKVRRGTATCKCGRVHLEVVAPPSSHLVEQLTARCSCRDCIGFVRWVEARRATQVDGGSLIDHDSESVAVLQVFDSDVTISAGKNAIRICKLTETSPMLRYYAACCSTPLGWTSSPKLTPSVALLADLFDPTARATFPEPTTHLAIHRARAGSSPYPNTRPVEALLEPMIAVRCALRSFYGIILGKGRVDTFRANLDHRDTAVLVISKGNKPLPSAVKATSVDKRGVRFALDEIGAGAD